MECKDQGPYHLRMSPEACENAGGHWDRCTFQVSTLRLFDCSIKSNLNNFISLSLSYTIAPCHTLKKCIDDRPEPETFGVCAYDITMSCRDNSVCPIILGTGQCTKSSFSNIRKVRIEMPFKRTLHMREVEVIDMNGDNVALLKPAEQSSINSNNAIFGPESGNDGNLNNLMQTTNVSKFVACIFVASSE